MIYDGTQAYTNGTSNTDRSAIQSVAWNTTNYNDAKYVGYMYGGANGTASGSKESAQDNGISTKIKTQLESWYKTNIEDTGYEQYLGDEIFCNDRTIVTDLANSNGGYYSSYTTLGYGNNKTLYMAESRVGYNVSNPTPTFKCLENTTVNKTNSAGENNNDWFTAEATSANKGNGNLDQPVGLITADEVVAAGGKYGSSNTNSSYYLYKGHWYWSFSPDSVNTSGNAYVFIVHGGGYLYSNLVYITGAVAPVINLSATYAAQLLGSGTASTPYYLQGVN